MSANPPTPPPAIPLQAAILSVARGSETLPATPLVELGSPVQNLPAPFPVLSRPAVDHNLALMRRYLHQVGAELAPHGKTSLMPWLLRRHLDAGAWAITAASVRHARRYLEWGLPRIIVASITVEPADLSWIADVSRSTTCDLYCFADSEAAVELLEQSGLSAHAPLKVLIEVGHTGGRTGVRSHAEGVVLAQRIGRSPVLELAGVAGFEGLLGADRAPTTLAAVDAYLAALDRLAEHVAARNDRAEQIVVSAGGSKYFDRVADILAGHTTRNSSMETLVLRSGCYAVHDHGTYQETSPLAGPTHSAAAPGEDGLRPALTLWAATLSVPEPGRAILGAGLRHLPTDMGYPVPLRIRDRAGRERPVDGLHTAALNDEHLHLAGQVGDLSVGDRVHLGISHPCGLFDRWAEIPVVDAGGNIEAIERTYFSQDWRLLPLTQPEQGETR